MRDGKRVVLTLAALAGAILACNTPTARGGAQAATTEVATTIPTYVAITSPAERTPLSTATSTPTPTLTVTPLPTLTPIPSPTPIPTSLPTLPSPPTAPPSPTIAPVITIIPLPTSTPVIGPLLTPSVTVTLPPPTGDNRLFNPGFEGNTRPVIFGEVNVFEGWEPFYCDEPYMPQKCPAERIGNGNPPGLVMGRPEYKAISKAIFPNLVHTGDTAQTWFCFSRACRAGVFQTFATTPGQTCRVGAWVRSWSNYDDDPESELVTQDDRDNSQWFIKVDPTGGSRAFDNGNLLVSRAFLYNHYDTWVEISYTFTATGSRATVFFENLRLWPIPNNDNYIDDAYAICGR